MQVYKSHMYAFISLASPAGTASTTLRKMSHRQQNITIIIIGIVVVTVRRDAEKGTDKDRMDISVSSGVMEKIKVKVREVILDSLLRTVGLEDPDNLALLATVHFYLSTK